MGHLLREPLVHFTALAVLVFVAWYAAGPASGGDGRTIRLTPETVERMASLYAVEARAAPSESEIRAIVADHVRETALAKEARRLGLDEGDTIIERRLAQKMTFLLSDRADVPVPAPDVLEAWYLDQGDDYAAPATVSFDQVFSADLDPVSLEALGNGLAAAGGDGWRSLGDATMVRQSWGIVPEREVRRQFGDGFADGLFALDADDGWQGPVISAFGAHFVRVRSMSAAERLPFEAVEARVLSDWQADWRLKANAAAIDEVVAQYTVSID